ncbi:AfsR/SARP family transcriptional regulator [Allorhizocola rhizosphaerae]|uniref:AfsR/SARP family transcriptional regulator n=1 Tax=Allorhizocola rhizosphaerae TaxID=1872709 RepID=UPI0013C35DA9|nr:BTAD domain-containing putative transcriptional regulator [Allorhizocola rhizosphaerae]
MGGTEFLLLGPVEVRNDRGPVAIGGTRSRSVLAALLLEADRVVSIDQIVDAAWGDRPPSSARVQAQNRVSALRRILREAQPDRALITTSGSGYVIRIDDDQLDVRRFARGVEAASAMSDREAACRQLAEALSLWRGPALDDLVTPYFQAAAQRWEEQRLRALERRVQLDMELGRHGEVVAELSGLVTAHPYRERFHALLMLALYQAGRQAEALDTYRRAREILSDQLGLEPGVLLQRVHTSVLRGEPPSLDDEATAVHIGDSTARAVPRELPADVPGFTGRAAALAALGRLIDQDKRTVGITAITGGAGVGKTALAVHWAHRIAARFPDGQLYVNLRGLKPIDALARVLQSLGVPADRTPVDVEAAAGAYRSMLADRQMLVLLDDVGSAEQVRPLLPGSPGCLVLITSRDRLGGLVARDGARRVSLDVLSPEEARSLLAWTVGADRVDAEPAAALELARLCAYLPLALRIAGANLTGGAHQTIAGYTDQLRAGNRVGQLQIDGDEQAAARVAFDLSYVAQPEEAQRVFRLLGLVPGADFAVEAVAALAGVPVAEAGAQLERLAGAHLVQQHAPGRYTFHDLLRLYAAGLVEPAEREPAIERLLDWYLSTVDAAARVLFPESIRLPLPERGRAFTDYAEAYAWLDSEVANLVSVIRHAAERGPHSFAWLLADALRGYFWLRGNMVDGLAVARAGLAAAEHAGDLAGQAAARLALGLQSLRQERYLGAVEHQEAALRLARLADWPEAQAAALSNLGGLLRHLGKPREAAAHLEQAIAVNQGRTRIPSMYGYLGSVYWELGRLADAERTQVRTIEMYRAIGSRAGQAAAINNLGETLHLLGRFDEAVAHLTESLLLYREGGYRGHEAGTMRNLAAVFADMGRHAEALDAGRSALALARETGRHRIEAETLSTLGHIQYLLRRFPAAVELHRQALERVSDAGYPYGRAHVLIGLATAECAIGRADLAMRHAREALDLAVRTGYRMLEGQALTVLAQVHIGQSWHGEAVEVARRALAVHRETGHRLGEERTLRLLAETERHPVGGR